MPLLIIPETAWAGLCFYLAVGKSVVWVTFLPSFARLLLLGRLKNGDKVRLSNIYVSYPNEKVRKLKDKTVFVKRKESD